MNIITSSLDRTLVLLAVAVVLQGCGEGQPTDEANTTPDAIQAGVEVQLNSFSTNTVDTNDSEIISSFASTALATGNPEVGPDAATSTDTVVIMNVTPVVLPEVAVVEGDVVAALTEEQTTVTSEESEMTPASELPIVGAALPVETTLVTTETPDSSTVDALDSSENEPLQTGSDSDADVTVVDVPGDSTVDSLVTSDNEQLQTGSDTDADVAVVDVSDNETVDAEVIVSENEPLKTDNNEVIPADINTGLSNDEQNIILGNGAGDAVCLNLDDGDFGSVADSDWNKWLSEFHFSIGEEYLTVEPQDDGFSALRQRFVPSSIGTDRAVVGARLPKQRIYRLTQSFYLEPEFDWGGSYEGGKLGFGFAGGTKPTGGTIDPNGFSSRLMWRGNGDGTGRIVIYSYAADRPNQYGEDIRYGDANVPIGEWFTVVMEVTANSSSQVSDGRIRGWIDGELVLDQQNMGWQLAGGAPMIDYLYYSGFYGGNSTAWSPSFTTHMKTRDVCWAAVVGDYSGIDPDNGRLIVATTDNPNDFQNDPSLVDDGLRGFVGIVEESLINIRSVAPVAPLLVQQYYDVAIAELTAIVINSSQVTDQTLSVNPVPLLRNAADQLNFASTVSEGDNVQAKAISGVQAALGIALLRSSELAIAVVDSAMSAKSCSDIATSPNCGVADDISVEINSLLESIQLESTPMYEKFYNAEAIWNRSVDALNSLD